MMMMNGRSNGRYPFTASQWQELEQQALIFKYMASGHPIPSDLILPIRRSMFLDSTSPQAPFFTQQPNVGWGCFQMGFGRKAEDPEPGRCRRTDGKKWRCSKEAHPDSKYCERHMHRGKNRSRKPVEISLNTSSNTPSSSSSTTTSTYASSLYPPHVPLSMFAADSHHHSSTLYPYPSSYSRPPSMMPQSHPVQFHLDSGSSVDREYRYLHGLKDDVDQYNCFADANGVGRDGSLRFTALGLGEPKPRGFSFLQQNSYSHLGSDLHKDGGGGVGEEDKQQHCFVLGTDFKIERSVKGEREEEEDSQRTLRHFFDEWPLKSKESWIGLEEDERSNWSSSFSKTQLSISTPMAHNDLSLQ